MRDEEQPRIPQEYIDLCKEIGALARKYKLRDLQASFRPGFGSIWSEQVEMSWASGRHYADIGKVNITSTQRVNVQIGDDHD